MAKKTSSRKILVIEDDQAMRSILVRKLKANNFTVDEADNGKTGLQQALTGSPDLILLDLMIPEIDGFTVLKNLRENNDSKIANVPVIVLSNLYSNDNIVKAQALKIQGYFVKAYLTTEEILKEVNEVLAKAA